LVVSAVGDEARSGWLEPLNKALYPTRNSWRAPEPCDWFRGDRTVLDRPYPMHSDNDASIHPGVHRTESGKHNVVWWDPAILNLDVAENFGLRHINVLKAEGASEQSLKDYEDWRSQRSEVMTTAAAPSVPVVRVTELTEDPPAAAVRIEKSKGAEQRIRGRRFGTLVHAILRDVPWDAKKKDIERIAALHKVLNAASDEEEREAVAAASSALAHPLLRRAAASSRCHREFPITLPLSGGRVLEGVVDLAFIEDGKWQVVDFKTDADLDSNGTYYENQLRWYMHALTALTGIPGTGTLLHV
jgi:ATP-dependent helicase/nuclease subunit A